MRDKIDKKTRSKIMASIKSKNTRVELMLLNALSKKAIKFKKHYHIIGHPDAAFPSKKIAIFIDGDFWHGYQWKKLKPKLKNKFWVNKIIRNMQRDKLVNKSLNKLGWKVIRIWEHEIRHNLKKSVTKALCRK